MFMLRFLVERMVLSCMALRGCSFIERGLWQTATTVLVDAIPEDVPMGPPGAVLYIPTVYNFPAVNAVLVVIDPRRTAAVYGIQVAISQAHSNSEEMFFRKWEMWLEQLHLPREKVQFGFVWIVEDRPAVENVPEKVVTLKGGRKIAHPDFKRLRVTVKEVDQNIAHNLSAARERALRA